MDITYLGWIGTGITILAFGIVNLKKFEKTFFPLNVVAAIFLMIYEFYIDAWPVFAVHTFILIASLTKSYKVLRK